MAYDEQLATNLRVILKTKPNIEEKKMFGGLCFLMAGHMLCGVEKERFMFRVGKEQEAQALARPRSSIIEFNGRRMGGLIWVDATSCPTSALREWVALAIQFVGVLPPKKKKLLRKP